MILINGLEVRSLKDGLLLKEQEYLKNLKIKLIIFNILTIDKEVLVLK